ncbi:MAG: T9SS type A sorting domain-containing protein [Bacteroidales bacterium]|jgi:hypothetical protein|nr:T9SS type A sorting domain-containing protein [Bacteroidales bacterium]
MKKLFILLLAITFANFGFSQKFDNFSPRENSEIAIQAPFALNNSMNKDRSVRAADTLGEDFVLAFPPQGWAVSPVYNASGEAQPSTMNKYGWASTSTSGQSVIFWSVEGTPIHIPSFDAFNLTAGYSSMLMTPKIKPSATRFSLDFVAMEFFMGNLSYVAAGMALYIDVSTDGGSNFINGTLNVLTNLPGHNDPSAGTIIWQGEPYKYNYDMLTYDLSPWLNQEIVVRFRAVSDWGGFRLLLHEVIGPDLVIVNNDVEVLGLDFPADQIVYTDLSANEAISVQIRNNAVNPVTHVDFEVIIDDDENNPIFEGFDINLASLKDTTLTFVDNLIDLSGEGVHTIKITAIVSGDENVNNDVFTATIRNKVCTPLVYSNGTIIEEFDSYGGYCWTYFNESVENKNAIFPAVFGSSANYNGSEGAFMQFESQYANDVDGNYVQYFISPELPSAAGVGDISLSLYYKNRYPNADFGLADEKFAVGYSVTNSDVASFTWFPIITPTMDDATDWEYFDKEIPATTKYIAIKNCPEAPATYLAFDHIVITDPNGPATIPTIMDNQVQIYPNPSNGMVNITVAEKSNVEVYDVTGKIVKTFVAEPSILNTFKLSTGAYFVSVNGNIGKLVIK